MNKSTTDSQRRAEIDEIFDSMIDKIEFDVGCMQGLQLSSIGARAEGIARDMIERAKVLIARGQIVSVAVTSAINAVMRERLKRDYQSTMDAERAVRKIFEDKSLLAAIWATRCAPAHPSLGPRRHRRFTPQVAASARA